MSVNTIDNAINRFNNLRNDVNKLKEMQSRTQGVLDVKKDKAKELRESLIASGVDIGGKNLEQLINERDDRLSSFNDALDSFEKLIDEFKQSSMSSSN